MATARILAWMGMDPSKFNAGIDAAGNKVQKFKASKLKDIASAIGAAFAVRAIVMWAAEVSKAGAAFDKSMRNVNTIAQVSEKDLASLSN